MIVGADKGKSYEAAKATRDTVVGKLNAKNLKHVNIQSECNRVYWSW